MNGSVLRVFSAWLDNETYGVNAKLTYLNDQSLLDGDTVPPDVQFIDNSYDDGRPAKMEAPPKTPALYVTHDLPASFTQRDQKPGQVAGTVPVAIRYITAKSDVTAGRQDAGHTMRAVRMSLTELFRNAHGDDGSRTRAGVYVESYEEMLIAEILETVGNSLVTGGMIIRCRVVDTKP